MKSYLKKHTKRCTNRYTSRGTRNGIPKDARNIPRSGTRNVPRNIPRNVPRNDRLGLFPKTIDYSSRNDTLIDAIGRLAPHGIHPRYDQNAVRANSTPDHLLRWPNNDDHHVDKGGGGSFILGSPGDERRWPPSVSWQRSAVLTNSIASRSCPALPSISRSVDHAGRLFCRHLIGSPPYFTSPPSGKKLIDLPVHSTPRYAPALLIPATSAPHPAKPARVPRNRPGPRETVPCPAKPSRVQRNAADTTR